MNKESEKIRVLNKYKPMTDKEWESFGYEDNKNPCCVCGKIGNNKAEPRFYYTICQDHANIPPVETNLFEY